MPDSGRQPCDSSRTIQISEYIAYESRDRLFRLWVDGHNHGLFWELDMAKEVAGRIHAEKSVGADRPRLG